MRLIVTRPPEDAAPLGQRLEAAGHEVILAPLLSIHPAADLEIPERDYQAVLITSVNGVRGIAGRAESERLKGATAIAVGPSSAAAARHAGFARVEQADGDVAALARSTIALLRPQDGPLLYVSGVVTAGDLAGMLAVCGFEVDRVVAYEARPADELPVDCGAALAAGEADGVILYSPRSARIWAGLVAAADLREAAAHMVHYCLSDNVAGAVHEGLGAGATVRVAPRPDEDAMLGMIPAPA